MRPLALAIVVLSSCQRHAPPPAPAAQATPSPLPGRSSCAARRLAFQPLIGRTYRFTADERHTKDPEGTRRKHYVSQVVFTAASGAWRADERDFAIPFTPWSHADPTKAVLHWTLYAAGVPAAHPTADGTTDASTVEAMSLFRFRTTIALPSTCVGDSHDGGWTELGRPRSISTKVVSADDRRVRLHVSITRGTWRQEGDVDVAMDDGLTGEWRIHELGPGAPELEVNDVQRVIEVTHD